MKKISRIEYCAGFEPLQSGMEQDEGSRILLPTLYHVIFPPPARRGIFFIFSIDKAVFHVYYCIKLLTQ